MGGLITVKPNILMKKMGWYLSLSVCLTIAVLLCPFPNRASLQMRRISRALIDLIRDLIYVILVNVDLLYWSLLFVPFYACYICIGEKLFILKSHATILQDDVSRKTKFIEWQNVALAQLDMRLTDVRKEVDGLRRSNDNFRREEEVWRKSRELLKKRIREQQKLILHESPIIREEVVNTVRQEIVTVVKKNKSESNIKLKKAAETPTNPTLRPKTQPVHRSLPSIVMETKKGASQEWERARLRLEERSKTLMRDRINNAQRSDEEYDTKSNPCTVACLSTVSESETEDNLSIIPSHEHSVYKNSIPKTNSQTTVHNSSGMEPLHHSRSSHPINKSFTAPGVPGYEIEEFGESKVKSYTEVFKRKVHVPTGGSGPHITIEGQRRWCF